MDESRYITVEVQKLRSLLEYLFGPGDGVDRAVEMLEVWDKLAGDARRKSSEETFRRWKEDEEKRLNQD